MFNKLEGGLTVFKCYGVWRFVVDKAIYIIKLDKTICLSLKNVRGVHLSMVGSLFAQI